MDTLSPDQWQALGPYLDQALSMTGEQLATWLSSISERDPTLAAQLTALLGDYRAMAQENFLENGPFTLPNLTGLAGQTLGPYTLISQIGQGGMGSVWLARRSDGRFDRQAAVKFVNIALAGPATAERFKREGSILGRLTHPHIAELLDAGLSSDGRPYLILEYVDGTAIDQYCDQHHLDLEARVRLFLDVLAAVAHAHANLIVHRDIKPSNVLVGGGGDVKLLDFGIAKLLEGEGQMNATQLTNEGGSPLTPQYAAPEQLTSQPITTATDVYSLGVLLYVLLAGRHPAGQDLHSPADLVKAVLEVEPPRASDAITGDNSKAIAENRGTSPDKLRRQLRGDLDTIIAKALKKAPAKRYSSVTAFADDLQRYLRHEPISARPDTIAYRAGKFVQRNRLVVALASVALVAILAGSGVAIYQARIAERRFQDVRKLAHTFVFDIHDEVARLDGSTKAREMIVETGLQYLDNLAGSAGRDLGLQREIAAAYMKIGDAQGFPTQPNLGRIADALESYRKAGDIYQRIAAKDSAYLPDLAAFYLRYGGLFRYGDDPKRAKELTEAAIQTFDRLRASRPGDPELENTYSMAWCRLGDIEEDVGHYHQAWAEFTRCSELAHTQLNRKRDRQALTTVSGAVERIGTAAQELGHLREALAAFDEDEAVLRELLAAEPLNPSFHRLLAVMYQFRARVYLAVFYPSLGDRAGALKNGRLYLETAQQMLQRDPNNTSARFSVAFAEERVSYYLREFDPPGAIRLARDSIRMFDEMIATHKGQHVLNVSSRAEALWTLGEAQLKAGRLKEAHGSAEAALAVDREIMAQTPPGSEDRAVLVEALLVAAKTSAAIGDPTRAESLLHEAREESKQIARTQELTSLIPLADSERDLGDLYAHQHRTQEERACYQRLVDLWQQFPESSEYVEGQRASSKRLLLSLR